jgi:hypothetical protein
MNDFELSSIFSVLAHLTMSLMVVYAIYLTTYIRALNKAFTHEYDLYQQAITRGHQNKILMQYIGDKSKGLVAGFYIQYRNLIDVKGEDRTVSVELKNMHQLLGKPELIEHFVSANFNKHLLNASFVGGLGTSLGMLFTIIAFVMMGFSQHTDTTVTSSLTALTTTGIGCGIALIADLQRRKLCLMINQGQALIEMFMVKRAIKSKKTTVPLEATTVEPKHTLPHLIKA